MSKNLPNSPEEVKESANCMTPVNMNKSINQQLGNAPKKIGNYLTISFSKNSSKLESNSEATNSQDTYSPKLKLNRNLLDEFEFDLEKNDNSGQNSQWESNNSKQFLQQKKLMSNTSDNNQSEELSNVFKFDPNNISDFLQQGVEIKMKSHLFTIASNVQESNLNIQDDNNLDVEISGRSSSLLND